MVFFGMVLKGCCLKKDVRRVLKGLRRFFFFERGFEGGMRSEGGERGEEEEG